MNNSIAFRTLLFKEIRRFTRIWPQTLLPPAITTSLYFLIFGKLIGERIGSVNGVSYMDYIVPGVILICRLLVTPMPMLCHLFIQLSFSVISKSYW